MLLYYVWILTELYCLASFFRVKPIWIRTFHASTMVQITIITSKAYIWTHVLIMHTLLLKIMLGFIHFPKLKKKTKKNRGRAQESEDWEIQGWMTYKTSLITICGSVWEEDQELQKWSSTSCPSCSWSWPTDRNAYQITGRHAQHRMDVYECDVGPSFLREAKSLLI